MDTTWILIADRARARLFRHDHDGAVELEDFANPDGRGRRRGGERPARSHDSVGPARHAVEPHTDEHDKTAARFACELGDMLERGRVEHRYDALVLVAPPAFLGALGSALPKSVHARVVRRVDKDLTRMPPDALRALVARDLLPARGHGGAAA